MLRFNHHHHGAYYLSLLKLQLLEYNVVVHSVVWLHMQRTVVIPYRRFGTTYRVPPSTAKQYKKIFANFFLCRGQTVVL